MDLPGSAFVDDIPTDPASSEVILGRQGLGQDQKDQGNGRAESHGYLHKTTGLFAFLELVDLRPDRRLVGAERERFLEGR